MRSSLATLAAILVVFGTTSSLRSAEEAADELNLVGNSGFEMGARKWNFDNWGKNEASFKIDSDNAHSGSASLAVHFDKAVGIPMVFMDYPHLPVKAGSAVRVRFWARGVSNGAPLTVMIRKNKEPYTSYLQAETILTDEWREFTYTTLLPAQLSPDEISLRFGLYTVGMFWLDDVSVVELPIVEGGPAPTVNPVRNPSFEAGTDGWTATIREREFRGWEQESGCIAPAPPNVKLETKADSSAPQGQRYLVVNIPPKSYAVLTSAYFPARYGHKLDLKFSLRADKAHSFSVGLQGGKNANALFNGSSQMASSQWQTFTIPLTLKPAPGGLYNVLFRFNEDGRYDIDDVTVSEAEQSVALDPAPPAVSIEAVKNAKIGNLYAPQDKAYLDLVTSGEKPESKLAYKVSVFDFTEKIVSEITVALSTDANGYGRASFKVPTKVLGAFRVEARLKNSNELLAEQIYSVLPPLPPPAERPDSFFGGHVDLTPYNLEIARRAGFRWLRLYPPLTTKWMVVEPAPGEWIFRTDNVANARAQGFRILGSFDTTPEFAADIDPKGLLKHRWCRSYPPSDLEAWKGYVTRCFNAFSPYIDAWEVWNEPDGGYLQVKPGLKKDDVYLALLKATREALDATGNPNVLLGPAVANINAPLGWKVLERAGGREMDAFSFHFYSLAAGGNNPDDSFVLRLLAKYRTFQNRAGDTMPLWQTEGGIYLNGGQSWLSTYRIPHSSSVTPPQAAASMVRASILFKAMGVKRYFDYQVAASAEGRRADYDITCGFVDVTGIPGPAIAAHAAMVALTEDAEAAGFEVLSESPAKVKVAHFKSSKGKLDVYWSGQPASLQKIANLQPNDKVRDMMGNAIPPETAQTGEFPLYVLRGVRLK